MLYDQDLPRFLWEEACNNPVYIQNRIPHRALGKKMPKGVFTEKKPEVSHLRIFGSVAYCHIPDEKRSKLDQTVEKGYLVGYSETSKAYKIYVPSSRKIVVRRDVKFMEDRAFRKSREMLAREKSSYVPLVQQQHGPQVEQEGDNHRIQEHIEPPTTSGRTGREVCQTLKDAEEFIRAPRADKRQCRQPNRYQVLVAQVAEPSSFQEAAQHQVWVDAMVEEYSSIMTNDVWDVVPRPKDRSVVGSKWIYKIKYATNGSVEKYKPRFMAKGYAQK
eukprot:PITA_28945